MANESRASMVRTAAELISTRGASATSFSDVLAASGAPRGSIYHHFPEGKSQLTADAVRYTGERVLARLAQAPTTSPAAVLRYFTAMWRAVVIASAGRAGCAVAGVAVDSEAADVGQLDAVRSVFDAWTAALAGRLRAAGVARRRADALAVTALAAMEGALILCRAAGDVAPLDRVAAELLHLV